MDEARAVQRRRLAAGVLVAALAALLATSPPVYEPDVTAAHAERVTLTDDGLFAAGTLVIEASGAAAVAAAASQNQSEVALTATVRETDAEARPLLRLVSRPVFDDGHGFSPDRNDWSLTQLCPLRDACARPIEVTVEWLNPEPGATVEVVVDAVAGIDIRDGSGPDDGVILDWQAASVLAVTEAPATVRAQTEPETVTVSAERPVVVRTLTFALSGEGVPSDARLEHRHLVVSVPPVDGVEARVVGGDPEVSGRTGEPIEVWCEPLVDCSRQYTVMLSWLPGGGAVERTVTWQAVAVARYPDAEDVPVGTEISLATTDATDVVRDERSRSVSLDGSVTRRPDDPPGNPPVDGARPELSAFAVDIGASWTAGDGLADLPVPVVGVMSLHARSESGDAGADVEVSIGLPYTTALYGPPQRESLRIDGARHEFTVLLSEACSRPVPCRVPVEVYVHPLPDSIDEAIVVDWSIEVTAVVPDAARMDEGSVTIVPGPFEPDPS